MDKNLQVIRSGGATRFSPAKRQITKQSGLDCGDGDFVVFKKSKKERLRKISVVGRVSSDREMVVSVRSDGEDEIPRKVFSGCNTVDHTSVPRKLRSAMKKRNRESISPPIPDSKKLNHTINGVKLSRKRGLKKSKLNSQKKDLDGTMRCASLGPITKDEEEVVETLFALAVLFPNNDNAKRTTLNDELPETKSVALLEGESIVPAIEVDKTEDHSKTNCPITASEATNSSLNLEESANSTVEVKSLNEPSDLRLGAGSKQPKHDEPPACERKTDIALKSAAAVRSQQELQFSIEERKSSESHCTRTQAASLPSSDAKIAAWLGNSSFAIQPATLKIDVSTGEDSRVKNDGKKSWKRCAAHVHISRLINLLKSSERKDSFPPNCTQPKTTERTKQGVLIDVLRDEPKTTERTKQGVLIDVLRDDLNGSFFLNRPVGSQSEKNKDEVRNAILLHKRLLQDQQQASSTSSGLFCTSKKMSFDFLSLSGGGGGIKAHSCISNTSGHDLVPQSQLNVPYLQSIAQNHPAMPLSLPTNRNSTTFSDHLSAVPIPQVSLKQQQQQQQRIWAAYYKPEGIALQYAQAIFPPSHSSLQLLGHKYASISQQQQIMPIASTLPPSRVKREYHNLPFGYEGDGGGFYPDTALPMQLLCNEHHL